MQMNLITESVWLRAWEWEWDWNLWKWERMGKLRAVIAHRPVCWRAV